MHDKNEVGLCAVGLGNSKSRVSLLALILAMVFTTLLTGCQDQEAPLRKGKYEGTFTLESAQQVLSCGTTLTLKKEKFSCTTSAESWKIHAGGSGTYAAGDAVIVINDDVIRTFDPHRGKIITGIYEYTYDDPHLTLWAETETHRYRYDLMRK